MTCPQHGTWMERIEQVERLLRPKAAGGSGFFQLCRFTAPSERGRSLQTASHMLFTSFSTSAVIVSRED